MRSLLVIISANALLTGCAATVSNPFPPAGRINNFAYEEVSRVAEDTPLIADTLIYEEHAVAQGITFRLTEPLSFTGYDGVFEIPAGFSFVKMRFLGQPAACATLRASLNPYNLPLGAHCLLDSDGDKTFDESWSRKFGRQSVPTRMPLAQSPAITTQVGQLQDALGARRAVIFVSSDSEGVTLELVNRPTHAGVELIMGDLFAPVSTKILWTGDVAQFRRSGGIITFTRGASGTNARVERGFDSDWAKTGEGNAVSLTRFE